MNIETAEIEMCLRKYQWALTDFRREIEEGCQILRTMSDPQVKNFLIYMQQLPESEQVELARAMVKISNLPAMQLLGESLATEEEARINAYREEAKTIVLPPTSNTPIMKTFAVKRADVAKTVLPILSSVFGKKPEKFASLQWFYTTPFGDWKFQTEFDFSGTWGTEIRCYHRLVRNDSGSWGFILMTLPSAVGPIRIPQFFSLLSLYGLSGGTYYIYSPEDVQDATQSIIAAYHRLFQAVPDLVDQLTID